jgi:lactoylglutathione lyase
MEVLRTLDSESHQDFGDYTDEISADDKKIRNTETAPILFEATCLDIKTVNMTLHVSDLPTAVSFYEDILGLRKKSQWHNYAVFDLCGMMLGVELGGEISVKRGLPDIYLEVDSVDDVYRELKGKGVRFLTEPEDQSWNARTAKFADPDGNVFILVQLKK